MERREGTPSINRDNQGALMKAKNFKFEIAVKIVEQGKWLSDDIAVIDFAVSEKVPTGIHPVDYLRQRLKEEINRHASQTTINAKAEIETSGDI
jgi:hypothetical protein